jgi:hypothetical protein
LRIEPVNAVQVNLTGIFLRDLVDLTFDIRRDRSSDISILTPSVLSTVGLRRATETRMIEIKNLTGLEFQVIPSLSGISMNSDLVVGGACCILRPPFDANVADLSVCLQFVETNDWGVGKRDPVYDLPVSFESSDSSTRLYLLRPLHSFHAAGRGFAEVLRLYEGRTSPETAFSDTNYISATYYASEPVVEWCMHNQRLKSNISDVFSLSKGKDLLSSRAWSLEDDYYDGDMNYENGEYKLVDECENVNRSLSTAQASRSNWAKPYLKNDSPEWTDMTCTLNMARERVMLPDSNWIWLNDWTVDMKGKLGETTDSDGWEYHSDFETFTRKRRSYERGDSCRRRCWTRTRIVVPPRLDDTNRLMKFVWESSKDETGNYRISVRSHLRIRNKTTDSVALFVSSPTWEKDIFVSYADPNAWVNIPVALASAVYLRLAKIVDNREHPMLDESTASNRILIVPANHAGCSYVRTTMRMPDVSGTRLHFLLEIKSDRGIVDISIEPVLRVVNLLPCQLECHLGEVMRPKDTRIQDPRHALGHGSRKIARVETLKIASGKEIASTAVSPWAKPHISLRVSMQVLLRKRRPLFLTNVYVSSFVRFRDTNGPLSIE